MKGVKRGEEERVSKWVSISRSLIRSRMSKEKVLYSARMPTWVKLGLANGERGGKG